MYGSRRHEFTRRCSTVVEKIERARSTNLADERSAEVIADDMIANLTAVAATIQTMPLPALRSLLTALIGRLEVDMATKVVQIDL